MVEHDPQLYPCLTARENLLFAARMHDLPHTAAVAGQWLEWAGLIPWACWTVGQLSRGMRQRVAIARAVLHGPAVVLLDEPFTALDPAGRQWVDDLICRLATEGRSVCFTTHEESDVRRLAGRVLLVAGGNVRDVTGRPAVRAAA
jgi:ABC-2 type transport system ATP-binding protein